MYKRRLLIFLLLVFIGLLVAVARLAHLQLLRGAELAEQAERAMVHSELLSTNRGKILDRRGLALATDRACSELRMDYPALLAYWTVLERRRLMTAEAFDPAAARRNVRQQLEDADEWRLLTDWLARRIAAAEEVSLTKARAMTSGDAADRLELRIEQVLRQAAAAAGAQPNEIDEEIRRIVRRVWRVRDIVGGRVREETGSHAVLGALDNNVAVELRDRLEDVSFAHIAGSTRRWYPFDDLACHVIGLVGKVAAEHIRDDPCPDDPLRKYLDNEWIGLTGVEKLCEPILRGVRGRRIWRRGGEVVEQTERIGGRDVRLTLDITLQGRLTQLLRRRANNGAIVVLSVPRGEVLALVSEPTYNLNTYKVDLAQLVADEQNLPLLNRAVGRNYPPGSTVKPAAAMAGLAAGVIGPQTHLHCQGYLHVPNAFRCWNRRGHGDLTVTEAIMHSCNVYFYQVGERLGAERLLAWMRQFGLGTAPGTGLPDEKAGLTPTRQWLWEHRHRRFRPGDARMMAIGQGLLLATPLQIANLMATIARDGVFLSPRLVYEHGPRQLRRDLVGEGKLPRAAVAAAQEGLYRVVNDPAGTARKYARHPSIVICGKTGTAQTERRGSNMVWFTGYAPRTDPQIAFAIMLEYVPSSDGGGGSNCGPMAPKLVTICQEEGYLPR